MNKKKSLLVLLAFSMIVFTGCAMFPNSGAVAESPERLESRFAVTRYARDVYMPIGGFGAPFANFFAPTGATGPGHAGPGNRLMHHTQTAFDESAAIGLTFLIPDFFQIDFGNDPEYSMAFLDMAYNAGLQVLVWDTGLGVPVNFRHPINHDIWDTTWARKYTQHPAFMGLHMVDEPSIGQIPDLQLKVDRWNEEFPDTMIFINLHSSYGGANVIGAPPSDFEGYRRFVTKALDYLQVNPLSVDHYPFDVGLMVEGNTDPGFGGIWGMSPNYFKDLALIRQLASERGVVSKSYILTSGHWKYKRDLTEEELRWQIKVHQAFGFEMIAHYAICLPFLDYDMFYENRRNPSLDTRQPIWYNVQAVNHEIQKWDHVYMRFARNWMGTAPIYATGTTLTQQQMNTQYPFFGIIDGRDRIGADELTGITSLTTTQDILAGRFADDAGNRGFMFTNVVNPMGPFMQTPGYVDGDEAAAVIELQFAHQYRGLQIFERGISRIVELDGNNAYTLTVPFKDGTFVIPLRLR